MAATRPSRKQARRDAVFVLYQRDVTGRPVDELLADVEVTQGYAADSFTALAVDGVLGGLEALDATLSAHLHDWSLDRLAPLERSILRLALYEIENGVTPPEVAVDEAVRLTKRYSTDEAGALVNGVLGGILRRRQEEAGGTQPE